jgi:cell division septal protein FtsQ
LRRSEKVKINRTKKSAVVHERTRQEKEEKLKYRFAPFFIFILFSGLVYLLFFSLAFDIKEIKVDGYSNPDLVEEIVEDYFGNHYLKKNIILFKSDGVIKAIKEDSGVRSVKVKKVYPKTLVFEIKESRPVILWNTKGENFEIDDRGYVVGNNKNDDNLPIVYDLLNLDLQLGERVASPTFINYIIKLDQNFELVTGSKIEKILIYDILSDVRVKSDSSWSAYFNASKDPVTQLENLNKVLTEAAGSRRLDYIDMRLETRIFYK